MKGFCWLICFFLLGALAAAASAAAAPIAGSFQVDLVIHSSSCGVDEDGDTLVDEDPPNGIDDDGDGLIDEDGCSKVSDTIMKFEADLNLRLTISGLELGSTTVFTFKGLEFQSFTLTTTIGALSVRDTFVFAPSIVEIEYVRTNATLTLRYCVNAAAPGDVTPPFFDCPKPDSLLFWLIEDVGVFHPAVANLTLAQIFDSHGMLDAVLIFRKKVVDLALNIAGLTISSRALFANVGTATMPSYNTGVIAAIEGQTVSGVTVRAESWLGARQGLECFAECKPVERLYGGKVIRNFTIQEEKLFIRNLTIAGVTFNIRAEFQLFNNPGAPDCVSSGICFVQIDSRARLQPLNLTVSNTLRLDSSLNPRFDLLQTSLKFGDVSVIAIWYFYLRTSLNCGIGGLPCPWEAQLTEFISTFDPPGLTITSDLVFCRERLLTLVDNCRSANGFLEHDIYFSAKVGNFTWDARFILLNLITDFFQLWVDTTWKAGNVDFTNSVVLSVKALEALAFRITVRF